MPRRAALFVIAVLGLLAPAAHADFSNPIVPNRAPTGVSDSADPWVVNDGSGYLLMHSEAGGVYLSRAEELGGLADAPRRKLWPRPGDTTSPARCCNFWAPELHRLTGPDGPRWYVYVAIGRAPRFVDLRLQVLESEGDDPFGPYHHKGELQTGEWAIDGTVAEVAGRRYVIYSGRQDAKVPFIPQYLSIAELANPWTLKAPPVRISEATYGWERVVGAVNEGPEVLVHDGLVHVVYSASQCFGPAYKLGRLTVPATADLLAPATWAQAKAPSPVFDASPAAGVFGPGHNGFFKSPDGKEDWIVYHAQDKLGNGCFGGGIRTARAQRFTYDAAGIPRFGSPTSTRTRLAAPSGDPTTTVQAEDLRPAGGVRAPVVRGQGLVGGAGRSILRATRLQLPAGDGGPRRVGLRVATGRRYGRLRVRLAGRAVGVRSAAARADGFTELDLGVLDLPAGGAVLELAPARALRRGAGTRVVVDQLRLRAR